MQFEPNWLESFILKWLLHQKKGENNIRWIFETNFNSQEEETKSKVTGSITMYELFIWVILIHMQELILTIYCLALDNGLPVSDNMKVLGLTLYVTKLHYIEFRSFYTIFVDGKGYELYVSMTIFTQMHKSLI